LAHAILQKQKREPAIGAPCAGCCTASAADPRFSHQFDRSGFHERFIRLPFSRRI